jgi:hypothetical protein
MGAILHGEILTHATVPNRSHIYGEEISAHVMVLNVRHVCGEEMLPLCAVPSGSCIYGENIPVHTTVSVAGRYMHMQQSPMGAMSVMNSYLHM